MHAACPERRSTRANQPVTKMSGVFVDLALALGAPIVPVRFSGGLPLEPGEGRLEFPVGLGRQDFWLGAPILPEALATLPYKERSERVMAAINALGPGPGEERPLPGDPALELSALDWRARGVSAPHAVILATLEAARGTLGPELAALLDALREGTRIEAAGPEGAWLATLARMLGT